MAKNKALVIEHEILKTLYTQASFTLTGQGSALEGLTPIYKRNYSFSVLHFVTLADALYNSAKYSQEKRPKGEINYMQNLVVKKEKLNIPESYWHDLANAIDVLKMNGHIADSLSDEVYLEAENRKITLLLKSAIDYRNDFYIKEMEKMLSVKIAMDIQKHDRWQKKYWYLVEIVKYIIGGILGAAIAFGITKLKNL